MDRTKWVDRKFTFNIEPGCILYVLERLIGKPIRLKEITSSINDEFLSTQHNNAWSIKQHIGHLNDLEILHEGRIDDFISRKPILRAADMSNEQTRKADHNSKNLTSLINDFTRSRNQLIERLSALDDETQQFHSLHPRLKKMMRPVDLAFFTAEHDDYHIAVIRELINQR